MKIALYGATGMLGQRILREALERGHTVTAVARDISRITEQNPNLNAVAGSIFDLQSAADTIAGHDAVISAIGPSNNDPQTVVEAAHALIKALTQAGVKRLVAVGGAGSLEVAPGLQLVDAPDFPEGWKAIALAHREALEVFQNEANELDWTSVSPSALIEPGERTGKFRVGIDQLLTDAAGQSRISAEDFAIAIVDEVETPQHIRQRFTVGY